MNDDRCQASSVLNVGFSQSCLSNIENVTETYDTKIKIVAGHRISRHLSLEHLITPFK